MALPAVLAWFGANGGVVHKHIQVAPMPGAGLGVRATDALPPGTVVVTVPEALFLWKRSAARKSLRPLLTLANLNRWVTLLLHVFYESTHPDGEWGPYFAAMPAQFDQPIFWPDALCEYALAGTALLERTRETVTEAANHFHRIFRPHAFDAFPELFPPETVTFERYRWVLGMVWSRAFGLSPPRERPSDLDADDADVGLANADAVYEAVCPVACFLNHAGAATDVNASVTWNVEAANLEVALMRPVAEGEEILISYDDCAPPAEFLARYGFLPDRNPCDAAEVLVPHELFATSGGQARASLLHALGVADTTLFVVPQDGWNFALMHGLRALRLRADELGSLDADTIALCRSPSIVDEAAARADLRALLVAHAGRYPGTIDDDRAALAAAVTAAEASAQSATSTNDGVLMQRWTVLGLRLRVHERDVLAHRLAPA